MPDHAAARDGCRGRLKTAAEEASWAIENRIGGGESGQLKTAAVCHREWLEWPSDSIRCNGQSSGRHDESSGCHHESSGCHRESSWCHHESSGCHGGLVPPCFTPTAKTSRRTLRAKSNPVPALPDKPAVARSRAMAPRRQQHTIGRCCPACIGTHSTNAARPAVAPDLAAAPNRPMLSCRRWHPIWSYSSSKCGKGPPPTTAAEAEKGLFENGTKCYGPEGGRLRTKCFLRRDRSAVTIPRHTFQLNPLVPYGPAIAELSWLPGGNRLAASDGRNDSEADRHSLVPGGGRRLGRSPPGRCPRPSSGRDRHVRPL